MAVRVPLMPQVARVHFGCHGGGAGHATRSIAVAKRIQEISPQTQIIFTCSGIGVTFIRMNGFRCIELPQPAARILEQAMGGRDYSYSKMTLDAARYFRETFRLIRSTDPEIVVSDMDFAATIVSKMLGIPSFLISHLVERYYYPEVGNLNYPKMIGLNLLYRSSSRILVPDVLGLPIPKDLLGKSIRIGYLASECRRGRGEQAGPGVRVLFVPSDMTKAMGDQIVLELSKIPGVKVLTRHRPSTTLPNVEFVEPVPKLSEYLAASNVVVCSGYTTVMEATASRTPCVLVPGNFEQFFIGSLGKRKGILEVAEVRTLRAVVEKLLNDADERSKMIENQSSVNDGTLEVARQILFGGFGS